MTLLDASPWFRFTAVVALVSVAPAGPAMSGDLDAVGQLLQKGRYAEAATAANALLSQVEAASGKDSLEAARVLDMCVESALGMGKTKDTETRQSAERALSIKESVLGPDHPEVAKSLMNLGILVRKEGDFAEAQRLLERSLEIREKKLGPRDPETAASLDEIADVLQTTGKYETARGLYERALAIQEESSGSESREVARTLNSLAVMQMDLGEYEEARSRLERALAIRVKVLGPDHPDTVQLLNNLGSLLVETGDYAAALPLEEQALDLWAKILDPGNPAIGAAAFNLANLRAQIGDYESAKPLYERAVSIWERAHGPEHQRVALALNQLGAMLVESGDYTTARPLLERALAITVKSPDPEDLLVADILVHLGRVARLSRESTSARPLLDRALRIQERILGPENPQVAETLDESAALAMEQDRAEEARALYERSLTLLERALGHTHPFLTGPLAGLAGALGSVGDSAGALRAALRAEEIGREHLRSTVRTLAERRALRLACVRASGLDLALAQAARGLGTEARDEVWDALVRSRAVVLDEMAGRRRSAAGASDPATSSLAAQFMSASSRHTYLLLRGMGDDTPESYRKLLQDARDDRERAEEGLAARSATFRAERERARLGLRDVESSLPAHAALVSYALYRETPSGSEGTPRATGAYMAFVRQADTGSTQSVRIGDAARLEKLVVRWREEVGRPPQGLGKKGDARERAYRAAGETLRRMVWDPVAPLVGHAERVFLVPDGALSLLNFATLPTPGGRYLLETGPVLHYLAAERDVVPPAEETIGRGLLALGDPDFAAAGAIRPDAASKTSRAPVRDGNERPRSASRGPGDPCSDPLGVSFAALPRTRIEVKQISDLWVRHAAAGRNDRELHPLVLTGRGASEKALKSEAPGRRVVHLATHGFLAGDSCRPSVADTPILFPTCALDPWETPGAVQSSPLLLSGLALAGANRRGDPGGVGDGEDGILTAEEVAALDLSGVEWVVLSACETGVGAPGKWEGILGLRRAFQIAGARTLIMSLWRVRDEAAREWMSRLYEARLSGASTVEAVHTASMAILQSRRSSSGSTHPFDWGAFVAAGDWR